MASQTRKPLKILTLDGGGLQAISTLVILDDLLETIAKNNGASTRRPRPCDVFDVISGIGTGGWLALLLGRFHLDVPACLSEYFKIAKAVVPRTTVERLRMRFRNSHFDTQRLVEQVHRLTKTYSSGDYLLQEDSDGPRCRHVFVAALETDSKSANLGYNLFRTYRFPSGQDLLEGPDPGTSKISDAFAATGAAKYFFHPWKIRMTDDRKTRFSDTEFPLPHNVTELALKEVWGLYGEEVPISVVVNVGPGLPSDSDVKRLARRFSWGLSTENLSKPSKSKKEGPLIQEKSVSINIPSESADPVLQKSSRPKPTFGSTVNRDIETKLQRKENEIESDIKRKLHNDYGPDSDLYFRLAPEEAPEKAALNDIFAAQTAYDATLKYLSDTRVKATIDEVVGKMPFEVAVVAA